MRRGALKHTFTVCLNLCLLCSCYVLCTCDASVIFAVENENAQPVNYYTSKDNYGPICLSCRIGLRSLLILKSKYKQKKVAEVGTWRDMEAMS